MPHNMIALSSAKNGLPCDLKNAGGFMQKQHQKQDIQMIPSAVGEKRFTVLYPMTSRLSLGRKQYQRRKKNTLMTHRHSLILLKMEKSNGALQYF